MEYLKQSTAITIKLGPFLDETNGKTAETALTISQADIRISKNGGAFAQTNNAAGATHDENGWYGVPLNTTDTATLGRLKIAIHESGALPCFAEFMVVTANVYDSLCSTDKLEVDLKQILGTALTETAGYIAAGFKKLFNVETPLLVASDVMRGTDGANTTVPDVAGTAPTVSEIQAEIEANGASVIDTIRDYIENVTYGLSALKTLIDAVNTDLSNGTDGLGALKTLIDTNKSELDGLQGADGKCLISTDAQNLSGTLDVNTKTATATALDLILKDSTFALAIADAIWDEVLTGSTHNIATSAGRRVREIGAFAIESGTAQAGTSNSITLAASASSTDGLFNRNLIVLTDNTGKGQTRTIVDYSGADKKVIVDRDWRVTPDNTTDYQIVPDDTPLTVDHGVARGGTSTTITIREYASSVNNAYLCNIITIIAGKGRGQARLVGAYNGTSKIVTICGDNWVEIPDTTSIYVLMPYGTTCTACFTDSALASVKTAIEVDGSKIDHLWEMTEDDGGIRRLTENALEQAPSDWDKAQTEHVIAGSFGKIINEINQSLNGAKCIVDRAASTFKVYDTDGETLLFTITKATVGNVDTLTRT